MGKANSIRNIPGSIWLLQLTLFAILCYAGIRLGGINVPLERIPWSILVPAFALFSLVHSIIMLGWRRAMLLFGLCVTIAFCAEYIGESTGLIFGPYYYTDVLGPKLFGRVPVLIPFAWYMMFYPSYIVTNILAEGGPVSRRREIVWIIWVSVLSALVMTAWDLTMDPVMSYHPCADTLATCLPASLSQTDIGHPAWVWVEGGVHFGVPLLNFRGWLLTAFVVFLAYRLIEPRVPLVPYEGHDARIIIFLPVGAYGLMALIDAWLGYPEIEDVHLISPFVMGIPFLFATFRLFADRNDLPFWPTRRAGDEK